MIYYRIIVFFRFVLAAAQVFSFSFKHLTHTELTAYVMILKLCNAFFQLAGK